MAANNSKPNLGYLNKLVDEYNNTYHCSIGKKPICAGHSALSEELKSSHKTPKFKIGDIPSITKYKNIFRKGYTKKLSKEIFVIDSVLKTNPQAYIKLKI